MRSASRVSPRVPTYVHSRFSSFQVALAPPSAVLRLALRTDGVFRYVCLPRRVERSSSQDRLFEAELRGHLIETAWNGFTGTQWYVLWSYFLSSYRFLSIVSCFLLLSRPAGRLTASAQDHSCNDSLSLQFITGRRDRVCLIVDD